MTSSQEASVPAAKSSRCGAECAVDPPSSASSAINQQQVRARAPQERGVASPLSEERNSPDRSPEQQNNCFDYSAGTHSPGSPCQTQLTSGGQTLEPSHSDPSGQSLSKAHSIGSHVP